MKRRNIELLKLTTTALLMALTLILSRTLSTYLVIGGVQLVKVGFSSVPLMVCSIINGPFYGLICGAGYDLIGGIMFPTGGAYFPGYTLDSALFGFLPGFLMWLLKDKKVPQMVVGMGMILLSMIGIYINIGFVEQISMGQLKIQLDLAKRILIPLAYGVYFTALLWLFFFLSKKFNKSKFSLLEIYVVYLSRGLIITPFLAPLWTYITTNISYSVGFMSQTTSKIVTIPIMCLITYLVMIPLSYVTKDILAHTYKASAKSREKLLTDGLLVDTNKNKLSNKNKTSTLTDGLNLKSKELNDSKPMNKLTDGLLDTDGVSIEEENHKILTDGLE